MFKKNKKEHLEKEAFASKRKGGFWAWLAVALALAGLLFIFKNFLVEWEKRRAINQEIEALQKEIEQLEREKGGMEDFAQYLKTEEFQEKELKDKLNLVKEGEAVVYVKEKNIEENSPDKKESAPEVAEKEAEVLIKRPNYYYWWKYFFEIEK